jgi:hypothetical protein
MSTDTRTARAASRGPGYLYSSLAVAFASASAGYVLPLSNSGFLYVSETLCGVWIVIVIVAVARQGWRGLRTLIGAPLVAWWPGLLYLTDWLCAHGHLKYCI